MQEVPQGEIRIKSGMAEAHAQDAIRQDSDKRHRDPGTWPSGGTVLKVLLLAFLVIVGIGWTLTLLN